MLVATSQVAGTMDDSPESNASGAIRYDPRRGGFVLRGMVPGLERKRLTRLGETTPRTVTWAVISARLREVLESAALCPGEWRALPPDGDRVDCSWEDGGSQRE